MTVIESGPATLEQLADRLAITELTSNMCLLVDQRDWRALEELFADVVHVDYTSLFGGDPQSLSPQELLGGWRQILEHLDATHHLIGGHLIAIGGEHATCAANVQATHVLANSSAGSFWTVGGRYDIALARAGARWRISSITLTARWERGNRQIIQPKPEGSD